MELDHKIDDELFQLVTFSLGPEEFGVDILDVKEIIRMMDTAKIPRSPDFVEGVINLRNVVIPIIDLRKRFGLVEPTLTSHTRIIVIEIKELLVGFIVDSVSEVLRIPANMVEDAPAVVTGVDSDYVRGVGKLNDKLLILLDLESLLSSGEIEYLSQVSQT